MWLLWGDPDPDLGALGSLAVLFSAACFLCRLGHRLKIRGLKMTSLGRAFGNTLLSNLFIVQKGKLMPKE